MRSLQLAFLAAIALLAAAGLSQTLLAAEGNPFDGWTPEQIELHRKKAASAIRSHLSRWLKSRKGMSEKCRTCRGTGKVKSGRGLAPCLNCRGTGVRIDREKFERVFWDFLSPAYRKDSRRRLAMNKRYSEAKEDPETAAATLLEITGSRIRGVEVKGNYAIATFEERLGREKFTRRLEWIEMEGDWWISDPVADRGFRRIPYAGPSPELGKPAKPGKAEPSAPPGKEGPVKTSREKKPLVDPETLFRMGEVHVKHVEENAYKVFGQIANKTKERRFAYIIVEVTFFKQEKIVDTVTCNVGTVILKPGAVATFSGYLYTDEKPSYDRIEAKVARYEQMD